MVEDYKSLASPSDVQARNPTLVAWKRPDEGVVKVNVDGSFCRSSGRAGFGGLLQDHDGSWLVGFSGFLGFSNIIMADLKAIQTGLSMAWQRGFRNLICESDSKEAIRLVEEAYIDYHHLSSVISNIRDWLQKSWNVRLVHVFREANFGADCLAKLGASSDVRLKILEIAPPCMEQTLMADAIEFPFVRP